MPCHEEQKTLTYTADELFSVVADVKDYPSFVPWCSGARIHREDPRQIIADLEIGFGPFQESFTSQITLDRPRQVLVRAIEGGLLEHPTNTWTFTPAGDGTHVDLVVDFQFKSHLLDHVANNMFHEAATRMMGAFESRVHLVHRASDAGAEAKLQPRPQTEFDNRDQRPMLIESDGGSAEVIFRLRQWGTPSSVSQRRRCHHLAARPIASLGRRRPRS